MAYRSTRACNLHWRMSRGHLTTKDWPIRSKDDLFRGVGQHEALKSRGNVRAGGDQVATRLLGFDLNLFHHLAYHSVSGKYSRLDRIVEIGVLVYTYANSQAAIEQRLILGWQGAETTVGDDLLWRSRCAIDPLIRQRRIVRSRQCARAMEQ